MLQNEKLNLLKSELPISALDFAGHPIKSDDVIMCETLIKTNVGVDYTSEKFDTLLSLVQEDGWTNERLLATTKYLLKTKPYMNWTVADFYGYDIKLYPYSWYQEQISKGVKHEQMEAYKVNGVVRFKMVDGLNLPQFEKVVLKSGTDKAEGVKYSGKTLSLSEIPEWQGWKKKLSQPLYGDSAQSGTGNEENRNRQMP